MEKASGGDFHPSTLKRAEGGESYLGNAIVSNAERKKYAQKGRGTHETGAVGEAKKKKVDRNQYSTERTFSHNIEKGGNNLSNRYSSNVRRESLEEGEKRKKYGVGLYLGSS